MAGNIRKAKIVCWKYIRDKPPTPSMEIKIYGVGEVSESVFRVDTGYPGQLLISTDLYNKLNLHLSELPEEDFGIYNTASGLVEVKRSEALIEIPQLSLRLEAIIETPRYFIFKRNLIGRELINKLKMLLNGPEKEDCIIE